MISISFDGSKLTYEQTMKLHALINQIHDITPIEACIDAPIEVASIIERFGNKPAYNIHGDLITEKDVYGQTHDK